MADENILKILVQLGVVGQADVRAARDLLEETARAGEETAGAKPDRPSPADTAPRPAGSTVGAGSFAGGNEADETPPENPQGEVLQDLTPYITEVDKAAASNEETAGVIKDAVKEFKDHIATGPGVAPPVPADLSKFQAIPSSPADGRTTASPRVTQTEGEGAKEAGDIATLAGKMPGPPDGGDTAPDFGFIKDAVVRMNPQTNLQARQAVQDMFTALQEASAVVRMMADKREDLSKLRGELAELKKQMTAIQSSSR